MTSVPGDLFSSQRPSLEPKHETLKPFLASHKEQSCNSELDAVENNMKSVNRKIIVRSKFFRNKLLDANDCNSQNEEPCINKENACEIPEDCPASKMTSPPKKRKLIDVPNVHRVCFSIFLILLGLLIHGFSPNYALVHSLMQHVHSGTSAIEACTKSY